MSIQWIYHPLCGLSLLMYVQSLLLVTSLKFWHYLHHLWILAVRSNTVHFRLNCSLWTIIIFALCKWISGLYCENNHALSLTIWEVLQSCVELTHTGLQWILVPRELKETERMLSPYAELTFTRPFNADPPMGLTWNKGTKCRPLHVVCTRLLCRASLWELTPREFSNARESVT